MSKANTQWFARSLFTAGALLASLCTLSAHAQDYPAKPVRLILPYAPGGGVDSLGRLLAQKLSEEYKQTFVIENRAGAAGVTAVELVMRSPADGYTLLLTDSQFMIAPVMFAKPPYDAIKDLTPVSLIATVPLFFAVKSDQPIHNLQELLAQAKANPGKFNYGTAGIGSVHHLAMESFKAVSGMSIVHVPYKGSGESVAGFLSGDINVLVASPPAIYPHMVAGTVRLIAATSQQRSPYAPTVPAIAETYSGYNYPTDIGLLAPTGTPLPIRQKLAASIAAILKQPDVIQRLSTVNQAIPVGSTPESYQATIAKGVDGFSKAAKLAGISTK
jgi:tripartite-type tricarboxylate transporter receptor subunit TctC